MATQPTRDDAWQLVCEWISSDPLRKHVLGVEAAMLGKPLVMDSDAYYAGLPFVDVVTDKASYFARIVAHMQQPSHEAAFPKLSPDEMQFVREHAKRLCVKPDVVDERPVEIEDRPEHGLTHRSHLAHHASDRL